MTPRLYPKEYRQNVIRNFSGGVNYRDGLSQVADGQLTDSLNVWYKDGVVRKRPAFRCRKATHNNVFESPDGKCKVYVKKENFKILRGKTYVLVVVQHKDRLDFFYHASADDYINLGSFTDIPKTEFTCNIFKFKNDVYCFCSGYYPEEETPFYIIKATEDEAATNYTLNFSRITDVANDIYTPTIFTNGLPNSKNTTGTNFEGYNLLSPYAKFLFSSSRPNTEGTEYSPSKYYLPKKPTIGSKVIAIFNQWEGTSVKHELYVNESEDGSVFGCEELTIVDSGKTSARFESEDGLRMCLDNNCVIFDIVNNIKNDAGGDNIEVYTEDGSHYLVNNVEITADMGTTEEGYRKILDMTFNEWFGGGAEGIYGGIHLFMGGNPSYKEQSLVAWSDFNKPLYFSADGNAYAGDTSQRVMAFGKQGEQLIILKQSETYATQYISNNSPFSAEDAANQNVIDAPTQEVTFPMIQVHGFIGCDCPHTVQLCRNRLVWLNSDGKVYTLSSASQWNERSIFEVSAMVERRIKRYSAEQMRNAVSADWEGHYILSIGDEFFVMDYNSYGYAHIASYNKNEDAQKNIPWWIWDKPKYDRLVYAGAIDHSTPQVLNVAELVTVGDKLLVVGLFDAEWDESGMISNVVEIMDVTEGVDCVPAFTRGGGSMSEKRRATKDVIVPTALQTKMFDFGLPSYTKSVPRAELTLGNNGGTPIKVTFITDKGSNEETLALDSSEMNVFGAKFFSNVCLRNKNKLNKRIGYRIESEGDIFVDSMLVHYQVLGGTK